MTPKLEHLMKNCLLQSNKWRAAIRPTFLQNTNKTFSSSVGGRTEPTLKTEFLFSPSTFHYFTPSVFFLQSGWEVNHPHFPHWLHCASSWGDLYPEKHAMFCWFGFDHYNTLSRQIFGTNLNSLFSRWLFCLRFGNSMPPRMSRENV